MRSSLRIKLAAAHQRRPRINVRPGVLAILRAHLILAYAASKPFVDNLKFKASSRFGVWAEIVTSFPFSMAAISASAMSYSP